MLGLFVFLVLYHGRQVEIASSLDFLWKQQARRELEEMTEMRRHTNQLLHNILPTYVAKYFLENERQAEVSRRGVEISDTRGNCQALSRRSISRRLSISCVKAGMDAVPWDHMNHLAPLFQELYAQGRSNAGVLFASIPNFLSDFYSEDVNEGMECIRLLNEIIGKDRVYFSFFHKFCICSRPLNFFRAVEFDIPSHSMNFSTPASDQPLGLRMLSETDNASLVRAFESCLLLLCSQSRATFVFV